MMTSMVRESLEKSEFWNDLHNMICNWDIALKNSEEEMSKIYLAQWEMAKAALKLITGVEWHFTRNSEYFGVCTEDSLRFLIRYNN